MGGQLLYPLFSILLYCSYVGLTRCSPELALAAVQVLHGVSLSPKAGKDMTATIVGNKVMLVAQVL